MTDPRRAIAADLAAIRHLVHRAYEHYIPRIGRPPAPMTADHERAIAEGATWVTPADGAINGLIVMYDEPDHVFVDIIAVDPDRQGCGIGSRLLAFAESRAAELGVGEVQLYTNEKMHENIAYYARRGYQEVDRRVDSGFGRVFFVKRV